LAIRCFAAGLGRKKREHETKWREKEGEKIGKSIGKASLADF